MRILPTHPVVVPWDPSDPGTLLNAFLAWLPTHLAAEPVRRHSARRLGNKATWPHFQKVWVVSSRK